MRWKLLSAVVSVYNGRADLIVAILTPVPTTAHHILSDAPKIRLSAPTVFLEDVTM